jgi:hypothetical protein
MLRKIAKTLAWSIGVVIALVVALYGVALGVNWRDQPPSAVALRLTELYERLPPVPDEQNGYLYMVGLHAPASESPLDVGIRHVAWMRAATGAPRDERGQPPRDVQYRAGRRPASVDALMTACEDSTPECAAAFAEAATIVDEWTAAEPQLLPRYRELLAHTAWRDESPFDFSLPIPSYAGAIDGQRLLLLRAAALANQDEGEQVRDLLERDARFWRMVLESADLLITKMIATAALRQHFRWGNLVLRRIEPTRANSALPSAWRVPITDSERSLVRCMIGEWQYVSAGLQNDLDGLLAPASWADRAGAYVLGPLIQRQDTANRYAEYYWELGQAFEAPLDAYAAALDRADVLAAELTDHVSGLYNPLGGVLLASASDFKSYAARVADLEGVRRAALAAATLRAAAVPPKGVEAALAASDLRNPYDDTALLWNEAYGTIVFSGLVPMRTYVRGTLVSEREQHRFAY